MAARSLRSGFTTGACAAAAAKGAALLLAGAGPVAAVTIDLPAGFPATFALHGQGCDGESARCYVIKDAGDDPDVTHGVEVHAEVRLTPPPCGHPPLVKGGPGGVRIEGGTGIGTVTKPGLAVAVGEPAINPVPRRMIAAAVEEVFGPMPAGKTLLVTLSIPDGEERAKRTLNARLGIVGGLSILGTSGVVRPISHQAWTDTIEVAIDVARAAAVPAVVLATGRTSEAAAQQRLELPEEAFVMMGDHVGYALQACHRKGVAQAVVAAQFAKCLKIACGHPQTHVSASRLDLAQLAEWGRQSGLDGAFADRLEWANTARGAWLELGPDHPLVRAVVERALAVLRGWAPGTALGLLLVGYDDRPPRVFGDLPRGFKEEQAT